MTLYQNSRTAGTTEVGPADATGAQWRDWHDVGLDCASVASSTRAWDVSDYGLLTIQVGRISDTTPPDFSLDVLFGNLDNEYVSSGTTITQDNLNSGNTYITATLDVSAVKWVRVSPSVAAGSALTLDILAHASNILGKDVRLSETATVQRGDNGESDAFNRLRISEAVTLHDSKQLYDNRTLFWDDVEVSGSGTGSSHSTATASSTITVGATTAGVRVRQTFQRFNYQPGKSHLVLATGTLTETGGGAGIQRSMGYYDDDNGLFFRDNEGVIEAVVRSSTSGSAVDTAVAQSAWNIDKFDGTGPSGLTLDASKSQIGVIDLQWLGIGRIRYGWEVNGLLHYCHESTHSNLSAGVYMSTPNLPVRYEIINDGTGAASGLECICSAVISEGGANPTGADRSFSNGATAINANATSAFYVLCGIRLKTTHVGATIDLLSSSVLATTNDDFEWAVFFNPTVANAITFSNETNSAVQTGPGNAGNPSNSTVTGGTRIAGGYGADNSAVTGNIRNALRLGSTIAGVSDEIYLCVRPLTSNADILGSITWREQS